MGIVCGRAGLSHQRASRVSHHRGAALQGLWVGCGRRLLPGDPVLAGPAWELGFMEVTIQTPTRVQNKVSVGSGLGTEP